MFSCITSAVNWLIGNNWTEVKNQKQTRRDVNGKFTFENSFMLWWHREAILLISLASETLEIYLKILAYKYIKGKIIFLG